MQSSYTNTPYKIYIKLFNTKICTKSDIHKCLEIKIINQINVEEVRYKLLNQSCINYFNKK